MPDLLSAPLVTLSEIIVRTATNKIATLDPCLVNPYETDNLDWNEYVRSQWNVIQKEWYSFRNKGGRLPNIEWLTGQWLGNSGTWQAGALISNGNVKTMLAREFPVTLSILEGIPSLRSALWSVLGPRTIIPEHQGPNPGILRFHLGIDCPEDAALKIGTTVIPYQNGESVLFDDTKPHSAWNKSDVERVTLFCEVLRPLPKPWSGFNEYGQRALGLSPRFRALLPRADAWHIALNPDLIESL